MRWLMGLDSPRSDHAWPKNPMGNHGDPRHLPAARCRRGCLWARRPWGRKDRRWRQGSPSRGWPGRRWRQQPVRQRRRRGSRWRQRKGQGRRRRPRWQQRPEAGRRRRRRGRWTGGWRPGRQGWQRTRTKRPSGERGFHHEAPGLACRGWRRGESWRWGAPLKLACIPMALPRSGKQPNAEISEISASNPFLHVAEMAHGAGPRRRDPTGLSQPRLRLGWGAVFNWKVQSRSSTPLRSSP